MAAAVAVDSGRRSGLRRWMVGAFVGAADVAPADGLLRVAWSFPALGGLRRS